MKLRSLAGLSAHPLLSIAGVGVPKLAAFYGVAGYFVGQVVSALMSQRAPPRLKQAALVPRRPRDYLARVALALVTIDDALRAQSIHGVAAAGITVALIGAFAGLMQMVGHASSPWLHIAGLTVAFVCLIVGLSAWGYSTAPWRVHRALAT